MYVNGHVDIFDMADFDMFTVVVLNMMVVQLGYTGEFDAILYNYLRPLTSLDEGLYPLACEEDVRCLTTIVRNFKAIIEEITDEPGNIAPIEHRSEKMLLLTWHDSSKLTKEPVYAGMLTPPSDKSLITYTPLSGVQGVDTQDHVINDVMRQLSFEETELDGEASFGDVAENGVESFGLSHDESFRVDDLDLNLNEPEPIVAEVRTQEPIIEDVRTQKPIVKDVIVKDYVTSREDAEQGNSQEYESAPSNGQFFYDDEGIYTAYEIEYDVQSSEDAGIDDDDDEDFWRKRMWISSMRMVLIVTLKFTTAKEAKDRCYLHSIKSRRNFKLYKNDSVRIRARCDRKVPIYTMSQGTNDDSQSCSSVLEEYDKGGLCPWVLEIKHYTFKFLSEKIFDQVRVNRDIPVKAVQDQLQRDLEVQISMSKAFRDKAKAEREIRGDHVLQYSMLRDYIVELQSTNPNTTVKIVVKRNTNPSLPNRGPFPSQVLAAVLDSNNGIYPLAYALVEAESRAKSDLLLNNICEVFNGKIVRGRDKPVITLSENIRVYCMKRIVNVQSFIDKCTGPLTLTTTRIMESIKKETHFMKVQWNGANKYQVSGGNNAEANGSASRQAQQTEPAVGQDCSGGSGVGVVIGVSAADGQGGAGGASGAGGVGVGVGSQVPATETKNADEREMGDGILTQSSAAGGASEWSFL
ncbi:hypothetical protein Tco_0361327 [Tanacetum coccineum]